MASSLPCRAPTLSAAVEVNAGSWLAYRAGNCNAGARGTVAAAAFERAAEPKGGKLGEGYVFGGKSHEADRDLDPSRPVAEKSGSPGIWRLSNLSTILYLYFSPVF